MKNSLYIKGVPLRVIPQRQGKYFSPYFYSGRESVNSTWRLQLTLFVYLIGYFGQKSVYLCCHGYAWGFPPNWAETSASEHGAVSAWTDTCSWCDSGPPDFPSLSSGYWAVPLVRLFVESPSSCLQWSKFAPERWALHTAAGGWGEPSRRVVKWLNVKGLWVSSPYIQLNPLYHITSRPLYSLNGVGGGRGVVTWRVWATSKIRR